LKYVENIINEVNILFLECYFSCSSCYSSSSIIQWITKWNKSKIFLSS